MRQKSVNQKPSSERIVKDIRRSVSCWTAFGVSTASRMLCRDITGQGNSIAFWINACAWPKNFQRKGGRVAGSFLAGRLGCQTDLSETASCAVSPLYFQSTSDQHPQVNEQTGMSLRKGVPKTSYTWFEFRE